MTAPSIGGEGGIEAPNQKLLIIFAFVRGNDDQLQSGMFSYLCLEEQIPAGHPLGRPRKLSDAVLAQTSKDLPNMAAVDSAGATVSGVVVAGLLFRRSERLLMGNSISKPTNHRNNSL